MTMPHIDEKQALEAVMKTTAEIEDLLRKSGYGDLSKAAPEEEGSQADAIEDQAQAPEGAEAAAPEAPAEEAPEGAGEAHGEPDGDESHAAMQAQAKELSDEELELMLSVLTAEKETRGAGAEAAAPEAQAPAAPAAPAPAEKSMKDDFAKLNKSVQQMADSIAKLTGEVTALKTAKPASKPATTKPVASNGVQVLEKSQSAPSKPSKVERLNKSESIEFLLNELKKGNQLVNSGVVAEMNLMKSQEDVNEYQDRLTRQGLSFPKL
jgi:chemotaxis protein histidine kinase CheA